MTQRSPPPGKKPVKSKFGVRQFKASSKEERVAEDKSVTARQKDSERAKKQVQRTGYHERGTRTAGGRETPPRYDTWANRYAPLRPDYGRRIYPRSAIRPDGNGNKQFQNTEAAAKHVGTDDMVDTGPFIKANASSKPDARGRQCGSICREPQRAQADEAHIHQAPDLNPDPGQEAGNTLANVREDTGAGRSSDTRTAGETDNKGPNRQITPEHDSGHGNSGISRVQDGISCRRGIENEEKRCYNTTAKPCSNTLGTTNEINENATISPRFFRGDRGGLYRTNISNIKTTKFLRTHLGNGCTSHSLKHGAVHGLMEQVSRGNLTLEEVVRVTQHKQLGTLLRYSGTNETTALALGTQRSTRTL